MKFSLLGERVAICAKSNGGKSVMMKYLLSLQARKFNKIFVVSPTEPLNRFYKDFVPENCILEKYDEKWVNTLIKKATEYKKDPDNKPKHILVVFDDTGDDPLFHNSKALQTLAVRGRHLNISIVLLLQYLNMVPPCIRGQLGFVLVAQQNSASTQLLHEYFNSSHLNREEFFNLYRSCSTDYNFFLICCNTTQDNKDLDQLFGKIRAPSNI